MTRPADIAIGAGMLGRPIRRVEDTPLLTGRGRYIENLVIDGALEAVFVRSPVASARIVHLDLTEAAAMPGVVAVRGAAELDVPMIKFPFPSVNPDALRTGLANGEVRHVGDPVAVVVATTRAHALDAAEAVAVEYDPTPAVVGVEAALSPGAPVVVRSVGSNLLAGERTGEAEAVLDDADVVVRGRFVNQRISVAPIEGHAIAVVPSDDGAGHDLTIWVATQMPHVMHTEIAAGLGVQCQPFGWWRPTSGAPSGESCGRPNTRSSLPLPGNSADQCVGSRRVRRTSRRPCTGEVRCSTSNWACETTGP
jgi:carbon-monoxide dehydrogenase large subunit